MIELEKAKSNGWYFGFLWRALREWIRNERVPVIAILYKILLPYTARKAASLMFQIETGKNFQDYLLYFHLNIISMSSLKSSREILPAGDWLINFHECTFLRDARFCTFITYFNKRGYLYYLTIIRCIFLIQHITRQTTANELASDDLCGTILLFPT